MVKSHCFPPGRMPSLALQNCCQAYCLGAVWVPLSGTFSKLSRGKVAIISHWFTLLHNLEKVRKSEMLTLLATFVVMLFQFGLSCHTKDQRSSLLLLLPFPLLKPRTFAARPHNEYMRPTD